MFESRYKNTGFANFILESTSQNAIRLMKYQEFAISSCGHGVAMFESRYENKGLVKSVFESISKNATCPMKY